jgi:GNAT superfamily N-acetyltransferase
MTGSRPKGSACAAPNPKPKAELGDIERRKSPSAPVHFRIRPPLTDRLLNALYAQAWPHHRSFDFRAVLRRSLAHVGAYEKRTLVGFVYLAWDGRQHAFLLEPTVVPRLRRQGVGRELVRRVVAEARRRGVDWVHVDYEPALAPFYHACGFRPTPAGLIDLRRPSREPPPALGAQRARPARRGPRVRPA